MRTKLTKEEKKISDALKNAEYQSISKARVKEYTKLAEGDIDRRKESRKDERINIRLTPEDLEGLRKRAEQEGLPYQTLVASVIHKYVGGQLLEINNLAAIKKALKLEI